MASAVAVHAHVTACTRGLLVLLLKRQGYPCVEVFVHGGVGGEDTDYM